MPFGIRGKSAVHHAEQNCTLWRDAYRRTAAKCSKKGEKLLATRKVLLETHQQLLESHKRNLEMLEKHQAEFVSMVQLMQQYKSITEAERKFMPVYRNFGATTYRVRDVWLSYTDNSRFPRHHMSAMTDLLCILRIDATSFLIISDTAFVYMIYCHDEDGDDSEGISWSYITSEYKKEHAMCTLMAARVRAARSDLSCDAQQVMVALWELFDNTPTKPFLCEVIESSHIREECTYHSYLPDGRIDFSLAAQLQQPCPSPTPSPSV